MNNYLRFPLFTENGVVENEDIVILKESEIKELQNQYNKIIVEQELEYLCFYLRCVPERRPKSKESLFKLINNWLKNAPHKEETINKAVNDQTGKEWKYKDDREFCNLCFEL